MELVLTTIITSTLVNIYKLHRHLRIELKCKDKEQRKSKKERLIPSRRAKANRGSTKMRQEAREGFMR